MRISILLILLGVVTLLTGCRRTRNGRSASPNQSESTWEEIDLDGETYFGPDSPQPDPVSNAARRLKQKHESVLERWGIHLKHIEPGHFVAGSSDLSDERMENEYPQKGVNITRAFLIGQTEVTRQQWQKLMGGSPPDDSQADLPMAKVSFHDAVEFCTRLSTQSGWRVRLPTEFEWEYAARAGTKTAYWCGDELTEKEACFSADPFKMRTEPTAVTSLEPNPWGLYGIHGNVWEWCLSSGPAAELVEKQRFRFARSGAWKYDAIDCRSASRQEFPEDTRSALIGFRVVVE